MVGKIFDVKPFAIHDGPGIRTTIFLKGCPLKCLWCHNPEGISGQPQLSWLSHKCVNCGACVKACPSGVHKMEEGTHTVARENCTFCGACVEACYPEALKIYGRDITPGEAAKLVLRDKAFYDNSGGGLTVSGGECLLQPAFIRELFGLMKAEGIHTAVDTSGDVPRENLEQVLDQTDLFLYDLKHADSDQHKAATGRDNKRILDNLRYLSDRGKAVEVRIPLIPGYNDTEENLRRTGGILRGIETLTKAVVLPYNEYARNKYTALGMEDTMPEVAVPTNDELTHAVEILRSCGVNAYSARE